MLNGSDRRQSRWLPASTIKRMGRRRRRRRRR
jgi:hypothetical protein